MGLTNLSDEQVVRYLGSSRQAISNKLTLNVAVCGALIGIMIALVIPPDQATPPSLNARRADGGFGQVIKDRRDVSNLTKLATIYLNRKEMKKAEELIDVPKDKQVRAFLLEFVVLTILKDGAKKSVDKAIEFVDGVKDNAIKTGAFIAISEAQEKNEEDDRAAESLEKAREAEKALEAETQVGSWSTLWLIVPALCTIIGFILGRVAMPFLDAIGKVIGAKIAEASHIESLILSLPSPANPKTTEPTPKVESGKEKETHFRHDAS